MYTTFLTVLFVILCIVMALFIYIQQGKGGGLGAISGGAGQNLFGGSGGQSFFEKATWIMALLFIFGALGLSILKTKTSDSRIKSYKAPVNAKQMPIPSKETQK